jgi:hypothetical protein
MTIDKSRYTRSLRARQLRGAAALLEAVTLIGATNADDYDVARVIVENELELRELIAFSLRELALPSYMEEGKPTVEKLEAILNDPADRTLAVRNDGSVTA